MEKQNENMDYRSYMSLLSLNYQRIYNFILMLVANHNDADDIMQEASVVMYEKFHSFEPGTDFLAWAKAIAKYQTLAFIKKKKREKIVFNQEIVELIDQESCEILNKEDQWLDALRKCVSLLPNMDRQLLTIRYHENASVKQIAGRLGCSLQKIYRNISRINGLLLRCIYRKVEKGEV